MRILLLIVQYPPDVNPTGQLMGQIAAGLVARGHQVDVLTAFPHYAEFRIWDEYRGKLMERAEYKGADVTRLWVYASGSKQNMLRRLASYLSFNALATVVGLARRRTYDVILAPNGSFFVGLASALIGRPGGTPFIYNIQDLYPETPIQAGQLTNPTAIRGMELLERWMYRLASHISVITPSFRENLLSKGIPPEKITLVPNFVDTDFIRPLPKANPWSQAQGLADKFVVTYAGNLGYVYDLPTLLRAAARLTHLPEIVFLIVGEGVTKPALERQAHELGLPNVRFLPYQPRDELPAMRAASDVQVSLYKPQSARYSMPSKTYEIMASGRPLLASADRGSDVWNLVHSTECGICVEPEDPAQLADAILALYGDRSLCERYGQNGRHHAEASYSTAAVVARYETLLQEVAQRHGRSSRLRTGQSVLE